MLHQAEAPRNHPIWQYGTLAGFVYVLCIIMFVLLVSVITPMIAAAYFMHVGPFNVDANCDDTDVATVSMAVDVINKDNGDDFDDTDFDF